MYSFFTQFNIISKIIIMPGQEISSSKRRSEKREILCFLRYKLGVQKLLEHRAAQYFYNVYYCKVRAGSVTTLTDPFFIHLKKEL